MRRLLLFSLVTICSLWQGCAALPSQAQLDKWKADTDKTLAAAASLADKAKAAGEAAVAKIDELKAAQAAQVEKIEAIAGALDADGNGKVSLDEAKSTIGRLAKNEGGWDLLKDPATYAAIVASLLGIGTARKGVSMLAKKTVQHGQEMIDADGDGVPDAPPPAAGPAA